MGNSIKKVFGMALLTTILAALAIPALAQNVTHSMAFSRQAKLGGQTLQPGKYNVAYDDKKDGEAVVTKDGKEVLKAAYKRVELSNVPADSAVVFVAAGDGSFKVRRIEIKGSKTALVFE
ncbi:MAG: hypothetical protein V7641_3171 [Blastocatellia bacterium]